MIISTIETKRLRFVFLASVVCFFISITGLSFNTSELTLLALSIFGLKARAKHLKISGLSCLFLAFLFLVIISLALDNSSPAELARNIIFIFCSLWTSSFFSIRNYSIFHPQACPSLLSLINVLSTYSVYLIAIFSLANVVVGNEVWSALSSSLMMMPHHIPEAVASSWWSNSNGIFANYLNPGSLAISLTYFVCLYLCTLPAGQTPSIFFLILAATILILTKVTTASIPAALIVLYCFIDYFLSTPLRHPRFFSSQISLFLLLPVTTCFIFYIGYTHIVSESSAIVSYATFLLSLDADSFCSIQGPGSECVRALYLVSSLKHLDPALIGKNPLTITALHENPHNFLVYVLQYYGILAFFSYALFLICLAFKLFFVKLSIVAKCLCAYVFFLLPFQGSPWTDGRNFFLFILLVHVVSCKSEIDSSKALIYRG